MRKTIKCIYYEVRYRHEFKKIRDTVEWFNKHKKDDLESCGGIPRYEKYNVQRRVACAAEKFGDYIVTGVRHFCPMMRLQINAIGWHALVAYSYCYRNGEKTAPYVDGFVDQYNNFLTREEAYVIAMAAGQIIRNHDISDHELFSEMIV